MLSGGWEIGVTGGWIGMGMRHRLLCSTAGDNEVFFDPCGVVVASCKDAEVGRDQWRAWGWAFKAMDGPTSAYPIKKGVGSLVASSIEGGSMEWAVGARRQLSGHIGSHAAA
jgi:hypothetical protein